MATHGEIRWPPVGRSDGRLRGGLLLLLRDGESYGRELLERLSDRGISVDRGPAYRTLRSLEGDGPITSRWTESHAGPRRRFYRLTREGGRRLAVLVANITATWQLHETLVRAHSACWSGARRPAASPLGPTNRTNRHNSQTTST